MRGRPHAPSRPHLSVGEKDPRGWKDEESRIHGVVRFFNLFRFAEADEVFSLLCSKTWGGHDFEEYSTYMDFCRLGFTLLTKVPHRCDDCDVVCVKMYGWVFGQRR